jgi:hypothetical protein
VKNSSQLSALSSQLSALSSQLSALSSAVHLDMRVGETPIALPWLKCAALCMLRVCNCVGRRRGGLRPNPGSSLTLSKRSRALKSRLSPCVCVSLPMTNLLHHNRPVAVAVAAPAARRPTQVRKSHTHTHTHRERDRHDQQLVSR